MAYRKIQLIFHDHHVTCPHCRTELIFTTPDVIIVLASRHCPKCGKEFVIENGKGVKPSRKKKPTFEH
jgi:transposase-like protein